MDYKRFGALPFSGGALEQPAELMNELRYIASVWAAAEQERLEQQRRERGKRPRG